MPESRPLYLLDTSAFRAISNKVLEALCDQGLCLYTSPYVFWELLSHLDEGNFDRCKGLLMKFKYVEVLDDPQAEIETRLIPENLRLQERVPDPDLILATLGALQASDSLSSFYSSYIRDSRDRLRQISGCAAEVRKELEEKENKYVDYITNIIKAFSSGSVRVGTDKDHHRAVLALVNGHVINMIERGASEDGLLEQVVNDTYIYHSHVFQNALRYFRTGAMNLPGNDYEDGCICLHLKLNVPYHLVTNDGNLSVSLNETIALIKGLNDPYFKTELKVYDASYLECLSKSQSRAY